MMPSITISTEMVSKQNDLISEAIKSNTKKLRDFIRRRINDVNDAEDVLQDVFEEFVQANRLVQPIEETVSWLFQVSSNKIIDRCRKNKPILFEDQKTA